MVEVGQDKGNMIKLMFFKETKHILLQAIRLHDAHRMPHGKKEDDFDQVRETLIESMPTCFWSQYQKWNMKSVRDKLRSMLVGRREANRRNITSSGIEKVVGAVEKLLDEIISEADDWEEEKRREMGEPT